MTDYEPQLQGADLAPMSDDNLLKLWVSVSFEARAIQVEDDPPAPLDDVHANAIDVDVVLCELRRRGLRERAEARVRGTESELRDAVARCEELE